MKQHKIYKKFLEGLRSFKGPNQTSYDTNWRQPCNTGIKKIFFAYI